MALYADEERKRELHKIVRNLPEKFQETFMIKPDPSHFLNTKKPWENEEMFVNHVQYRFWIHATTKSSVFLEEDNPTAVEIKSRMNFLQGLMKKGCKRAVQMNRVNKLQVLIRTSLNTCKNLKKRFCNRLIM